MKHLLTIFLVLLFSKCVCAQNSEAPKHGAQPFVLGVTDHINSAILHEERTLNIYLPDGYTQNDTLHYPVIYLLDGSAEEDFIHIAGLVQFSSFPWINRLPKTIVVGIANIDRRRDFTFATTIESDKTAYPTTGHSTAFITFIENELQPFINHKYKTTPMKTIIGELLGGLLATEILLSRPALFNKYIIVSPSIWWNNGSILDSSITQLQTTKQSTDVYIAVGKEGLTPTKIPRVMEVDANLLADKINSINNKSLKVIFDFLPQEDHGTILHQAVYNAFRVLYQPTTAGNSK